MRLIGVLILFAFANNLKASMIEYPKFYFSIGFPYINIHDNEPSTIKDFTGLNIGTTLQYNLSESSSMGLALDASYSPNREDLMMQYDNRILEGDASLLTSFYSLVYMHRIGFIDDNYIWFSAGPSLGLYTLNFYSFERNNTNINKVNRIRVRNHGYRLSLKLMPPKRSHFWELVYYHVEEDTFNVIDDSSLDAQEIREDSSINRKSNHAIILKYGMKLF